MIDERALEAAKDAVSKFTYVDDVDVGPVARAAIEAYEAAIWRPIEEAPRDGQQILVCIKGDYPDHYGVFSFMPSGKLVCSRTGLAFRDRDEISRVMFRTITPPPQAKP